MTARLLPALVLAVVIGFVVSACAARDTGADGDRHNGFYGGISAGMN